MKILGVNISHESSFCLIEDGQIIKFVEEERCRREKYWDMQEKAHHKWESLSMYSHLLNDLDYIIFSSFDRRSMINSNDGPMIDPEKGGLTTWQEAEQFMSMFNSNLLNRTHYEYLSTLFPNTLKEIDWDKQSYPHNDTELIRRIVQTHFPEMDEDKIIFQPTRHHVYHVLSGYYFSPWANSEEAIGIAWDGGGAKTYHESWPDFQEVETIWRLIPGENPLPLWKSMSNLRAINDMEVAGFPHLGYTNYPNTMFISQNINLETDMSDEDEDDPNRHKFDVEYHSKSSNGMNFSELCVMNGFDELGRNSGKVMGYAAYGQRWNEHEYDASINSYSRAEITHYMQRKSFDNAVATIQRAIDLNPDCKNIVLSGGFSLNCTNNYKYLEKFPKHKFFVDPAANDSGTAIGAALFQHNESVRS